MTGDSLVFAVSLSLPTEIVVAGRTWFRRPELHVTTFIPDDVGQATGLGRETLVAGARSLEDELTAVRPIRFDGRVSRAWAGDGRETLVAFCDVDGLEAVYERLSAAVGRQLPRPPTHVTLYTAEPRMRGIGLATDAHVRAQTAALAPADAAVVLRAIGLVVAEPPARRALVAARVLRLATRLRRVQPLVGRLHARVLRRSGGRLRRSRVLAGGQPVLALTTVGRRSGRERSTTIAYVAYGDAYAVGALNLGSDRHPAWCLNLRADPRAILDVAGRRIMVRAREAAGEEAERLWRAFTERLPAIAATRSVARREVPIFVLDPVQEGPVVGRTPGRPGMMPGVLRRTTWLALAAAVAVALAARPAISAAPPAGVSYSGAVDATLARGAFLLEGGRVRRDVALTFDDGPSPWTPLVARTLVRLRAPGTFFEIGRNVRSFPHYSRLLVRDGFPVADHTLTHPLLAHHFIGDQRFEIASAATELVRHGVPFPRLFRPPYGSWDDATYSVLAQLRMLMVLWSADSRDYATPGVPAIVHNALAGVHPGSIVLMHDGGGNRSQTVRALPIVIRRLRAMGYRLVSVPQMLAEDPPVLPQKVPSGMGPGATAS